MQTATRSEFVPVDEYLSAEAQSEVRHEYLGGLIYAMAGETRDHNTIALNLASTLREKLRGGRCKVYMSGVRLNLFLRADEYYYYPDIMVTCDARDSDKRVIRHPNVIIEVLSESTERVDRGEKFFAYTSVESLEEYVLVAQQSREITIFRRANDWKPESAESVCRLESLNVEIPLAAAYDGI